MIIFWDIDGTLIENDTKHNLFNDSLHLTVNTRLSETPSHHGKVDKQIIQEYLTAAGHSQHHETLMMQNLDILSTEHYSNPENARKPLPGVIETITKAQQQGFINALFTGNSKTRSESKLQSSGFNLNQFHWDKSFFGSEFNTRPHMAAAAANYTAQAIIIGDTPGDGTAANIAGYPFVAVCTGIFTAEELAPYNPALTLPSFADNTSKLLEILR